MSTGTRGTAIAAGWILSTLVIGILPEASAAELHVDSFDFDSQGWTGGSIISWNGSGGPSGTDDGFISAQANFGNLATHNSLSAWTGDFASVGATRITADLAVPQGSSPISARIVLFGPGSDPGLSPRWTSLVAEDIPADGIWRKYEFGLHADDLTQVLGMGSYEQLMAGVLRVMLRHDPGTPSAGGTGVVGTLFIDNVALQGDPLAGDYNADGVVDAADYTTWRDNLNAAAGTLPNDIDGGSIGPSQYVTWRANFGKTQSPIATTSSATIPEPSSGLLSVLVFAHFAFPNLSRRD